MNYYLPLLVNGRRMHVFQLKQERFADMPWLSFVVKRTSGYELVSLPSLAAMAISDESRKKNIRFDGSWKFTISEDQERNFGIPCYVLTLRKQSHNSESGNGLCVRGRFGSVDFMRVAVDVTKFPASDFVLVIQMAVKDDVYESACRFCQYDVDDDLVSASLDFGSEASQIKLSTQTASGVNMNIVREFVEMTGMPSQRYYQGNPSAVDPSAYLFRSIYYLQPQAGKTCYGDLPMNNGKDTYVQSLLPVITPQEDIQKLELLPNLKLMELCTFNKAFKTINFAEGSDVVKVSGRTLADDTVRKATLRLVLSNFLSVVMHHHFQDKSCIRFVLLVPNVYNQDKIAELVQGLYLDFKNIHVRNPKYNNLRGIEVQVVSESDAAFLGMKSANDGLKKSVGSGAHFLIVDAGKGTTDFSILKQRVNQLNFDSVYRYGIPASGHAITYAFYEALRTFIKEKTTTDIDRILAGAKGGHILQFVEALESLKQIYVDSSDFNEDLTLNEKNFTDLATLSKYIATEFIADKKRIPGCSIYVGGILTDLANLMTQSVIKYAKENHIGRFLRVVLSGRAFLFKPLQDKLSKLLLDNGLVASQNDIVFVESLAKKVCTEGAMAVEQHCQVNANSGLIGTLSLIEKDKPSLLTLAWRWLTRKPANLVIQAETNYDFFYKGLSINSMRNVDFDVSGRTASLGDDHKVDRTIYYTGTGFLCQKGDGIEDIQVDRNLFMVNEEFGGQKKMDELIMKSLFPFNITHQPEVQSMQKVDPNKVSQNTIPVAKTSLSSSEVDLDA